MDNPDFTITVTDRAGKTIATMKMAATRSTVLFADVDYVLNDGALTIQGVLPRVHALRVSVWRLINWAFIHAVNKHSGSDPFTPISNNLESP